VIEATIFIGGITVNEFNDQSNSVRFAFIQAIKTRLLELFSNAAEDAGVANTQTSANIIIVVISTRSQTLSGQSNNQGRRRLLTAEIDGVEVAFSVTSTEMEGVSEAEIASDLGSFLKDTTTTGFSAALPPNDDGEVRVHTRVVAPSSPLTSFPHTHTNMRFLLSSLSQPRSTSVLSAPAAQRRAAIDSSDDKSDSFTIQTAAIAGAAIAALVALLLIAALIATVTILVVVVLKKKTQVTGGAAVVSQADLQRVYGKGYGAFLRSL
jgi:hypothetical protein